MKGCLERFPDPVKFTEATDALYDMFDREVFDMVASLDSNGLELGSVVAYRLHKGLMIASIVDGKVELPIESNLSGSKIVIVGRQLKDGADIRAMADAIISNGASIVKMGFLTEDGTENARKKLFRGIPLESRNIY